MSATMTPAVARAILRGIGARPTAQDIGFLQRWSAREGVPQTIDANNWLGTTLPVGGSHGTNAPGVQDYGSLQDGIAAHIRMLNQGNFSAIRSALQSGDPSRFAGDPGVQKEFLSWSGGGYSFPVAAGGGGGPVAVPQSSGQPSLAAAASGQQQPQQDFLAPVRSALQQAVGSDGLDRTGFYNTLRTALHNRQQSEVPAAAGGGGGMDQGSSPMSLALAAIPNQFATRGGIQVDSRIVNTVDQLARQFGVKVNSGYRSPQHNAQVGGASNSDHLRGDAVDFTGSPAQMAALYQYAQGRYPYVEPMAQAQNHVHVSFRR